MITKHTKEYIRKQDGQDLLLIILVACIILIGVVLYSSNGSEQSKNSTFYDIQSNVQNTKKSVIRPMDHIPPNDDWNNPKIINSRYYPNALKKPFYFQLMNNPHQTYVATKWKWSKSLPLSFTGKKKFRKYMTGTWHVVSYHKTNKKVKLSYDLPSLPKYITYRHIKNMTNGTPINDKKSDI